MQVPPRQFGKQGLKNSEWKITLLKVIWVKQDLHQQSPPAPLLLSEIISQSLFMLHTSLYKLGSSF